MKVEQRKIGFNFRALGEILFGESIKSINEQKQQEEEIQKELDKIYEEEKRSGATKRIQELSDKLSKHEEVKDKKQKIQKIAQKVNIDNVKQDKKIVRQEDREIAE